MFISIGFSPESNLTSTVERCDLRLSYYVNYVKEMPILTSKCFQLNVVWIQVCFFNLWLGSTIGFRSSVKINKGIWGKIFDIFTKYVNSILFKYRLRPVMQSSSNEIVSTSGTLLQLIIRDIAIPPFWYSVDFRGLTLWQPEQISWCFMRHFKRVHF